MHMGSDDNDTVFLSLDAANVNGNLFDSIATVEISRNSAD